MCENRKRKILVRFRVDEKEKELLDKYVSLSGLSRQEYLQSNMLHQQIVVKGNPRVFKALKTQMEEILLELKRIEKASEVDEEFRRLIKYVEDMAVIMAEENQQFNLKKEKICT